MLPDGRFQLDHARSNLIWNLKTREELRDALEGEMRAFGVDRELGNATVISWNHQEFEVSAPAARSSFFLLQDRCCENVRSFGSMRG